MKKYKMNKAKMKMDKWKSTKCIKAKMKMDKMKNGQIMKRYPDEKA